MVGMDKVKFYRVLALPDTLEQDAVYFVSVGPTEADMVIVGQDRIGRKIAAGPQGPVGPAGAGYLHTQTTAAATWIINHNLGRIPSVSLFFLDGTEFFSDVLSLSNAVTVTFPAPVSGIAVLN